MIIELLWPSFVIAALIALTAGLLSCFVVWRRMAFFADALSHSAILGTAIAVLLNINPLFGLFAYGVLVALLLNSFTDAIKLSSDTLLAIISQTSLAVGLLAIGLLKTQFSLESLLFGDILAVSSKSILPTAIICSIIIITSLLFKDDLIRLCLDEKLAFIEGVNTERAKKLLMLMLVALIATAIQLLGVLLVSTLLLMPAASARQLASSPNTMLLTAPIFAFFASFGGLFASIQFDHIATSPAIVTCAASMWLGSLAFKKLIQNR